MLYICVSGSWNDAVKRRAALKDVVCMASIFGDIINGELESITKELGVFLGIREIRFP